MRPLQYMVVVVVGASVPVSKVYSQNSQIIFQAYPHLCHLCPLQHIWRESSICPFLGILN